MSDEPKPTSERARRRALGEVRREALIKRREACLDLLVSGYSVEEIASHMKKSPPAVRRAVVQALTNRRLDAPEDYALVQVARLTKALRCVDGSPEEGDLKAIAPFLKVVREMNLYHGVNISSGATWVRGATGNRARFAPASCEFSLGCPSGRERGS